MIMRNDTDEIKRQIYDLMDRIFELKERRLSEVDIIKLNDKYDDKHKKLNKLNYINSEIKKFESVLFALFIKLKFSCSFTSNTFLRKSREYVIFLYPNCH